MEGPNNKPEKELSKQEKIRLFGDFLMRSRKNSTMVEIAKKLNLNTTAVLRWESGEAFPKAEKLPLIAEAYEVNLEELTRIFDISKQARKNEKEERQELKNPTKKEINPDTEVFWGSGGPARSAKKSKS